MVIEARAADRSPDDGKIWMREPLGEEAAVGAISGAPAGASAWMNPSPQVDSGELAMDRARVGGRFWALADGEEAESSSEEEENDGKAENYVHLCRTPSPERESVLSPASSRASKRMAKRQGQRLAALTFVSCSMDAGTTVETTQAARLTRFRVPKIPVLEPSVVIEERDLGGWIRVLRHRHRHRQRRRQVSSPARRRGNCGSCFRSSNERNHRSGLVGIGPARPAMHESPLGVGSNKEKKPSDQPNTAGVGLRGLLGLFWARVAAPVVCADRVMASHGGGGRGGGEAG